MLGFSVVPRLSWRFRGEVGSWWCSQRRWRCSVVSMVDYRLIAAVDSRTNGIGVEGGLPWPSLPEDMKHFRSLTMGHAVVMGRLTYESIPAKFRPLRNRVNVVITRDCRAFRARDDVLEEVLVAESLEGADELLKDRGVKLAFIIGGAQIYQLALEDQRFSGGAYITEVSGDLKCDTFLPALASAEWQKVSVTETRTHEDLSYRFVEYTRRSQPTSDPAVANGIHQGNPEEMQYLNLVRQIIDHGNEKGDRTGTGTRAIFGAQMRFNLRESFPLLTTKRVFWRGVAEELLWFLKGSTDADLLAEKNVHIWDGNGSREFLDKLGFHERRVGDLGPVYGFQWRHFGAAYEGPDADYTGKGVDQLHKVIETIKNNPDDRRMVVSAWNPIDLEKMALPPCHLLFQFYVFNGELSCQMYQRSCDMGLGVPFNIASYALLTRLVAHHCGLKPGDLVHTLGDAHVYNSHIDALKVQLERTPHPFPRLVIKDRPDRVRLEDFCFTDLVVEDYQCHGPIKMTMAV